MRLVKLQLMFKQAYLTTIFRISDFFSGEHVHSPVDMLIEDTTTGARASWSMFGNYH